MVTEGEAVVARDDDEGLVAEAALLEDHFVVLPVLLPQVAEGTYSLYVYYN